MPPQTAEARRLRNRSEMRRAILDVAERQLVEHGTDSFSMRKLADRFGCTPPTLYHYFRDKDQLVDSVLQERLAKLAGELRAVSRSGDVLQDIQARFAAFAHFGVRNADHYELLVARGARAEELPAGAECRRLLQAPLDALVRQGAIDTDRLELLEQTLWSFLHGWIVLQMVRPDEEWRPELLLGGIESIVHGYTQARTEEVGS